MSSIALDEFVGRAENGHLSGPEFYRLLQERGGVALEPEEHRKMFPGRRVHSQASSPGLLQEVLQESSAADVSLLPAGPRLWLHDKDGPVVQSFTDALR